MGKHAVNEQNARFWLWHHQGWVKLTVKPNQTVSFSRAGAHDEGWYRNSSEITCVDSEVIWDYCNDGADCDGRQTTTGRLVCKVEDLATERSYDAETELTHMVPKWEKMSSSQYDQYAELAGY